MDTINDKRRPDYTAMTVIDVGLDQSRWREIGVGFINEKSGTITVLLDAVPVTGKVVLTKPRHSDISDVSLEPSSEVLGTI